MGADKLNAVERQLVRRQQKLATIWGMHHQYSSAHACFGGDKHMHLPVDDVVYLSHAPFLCGSLSQLRHGDPSLAADLMSLKEFLTITTTITKAAAPTTLATAATT